MKTLLLLLLTALTVAEFPCTNDFQCYVQIGEQSSCEKGVCVNPFYRGGCLRSKLTNWTQLRTCNSQDPPEAAELGYCQLSQFDYTEIRIEIQNWDSATFVTYLMQILLSELLGVPTSIETSFQEFPANLYHENMTLIYGWSNDERAMNRSSRFGDCVPFTTKPPKEGAESSGIEHEVDNELEYPGYLACAHVIPESVNSFRWTQPFVEAGVLEPSYPNGALGRQGWYIPLKTVKEDPSLLHWTGLSGSENRQKLARMFKRPVEFLEYCRDISPNNCSTPDKYALRYPTRDHDNWHSAQNEEWRFFVPGVYTGYFQYTDENNCTDNDTCTGCIVDFPCGWNSYTEAQAYHLDIALKSSGPSRPIGGYWAEIQRDIWRAANATGENVIMQYFEPNGLINEFLGTDYSFEKVGLPHPTQECIDARRPSKLRCSDDIELRLGDPAGACDEPPEALAKLFSTALFEITKGAGIRPEFHSPAYDALRSFSISDLRIGEMYEYFNRWENIETKKEFGLRDTACQWAADNIDLLQSFIPKTHPRTIQDGTPSQALTIATLVLGAIAILVVIITIDVVFTLRKRRVMRLSQIEFLRILLMGLLLIAIGSLLGGATTVTNGVCIAKTWLIGVGYTLELVPLIVKQAAINKVVHASSRMRRVKVSKHRLFGYVILITFLEVTFLMLWTIMDAPKRDAEYQMSDAVDETSGSYVVEAVYYCSNGAQFWDLINTGWNTLLLLVATIYTLQIRKAFDEIKEARTLASMIYFQFTLVIFRLATFFLSDSLSGSVLDHTRSLIYAADAIGACLIYFVPKLLLMKSIEGNTGASMHVTFQQGSGDAQSSGLPLPMLQAMRFISNLSSVVIGGAENISDEEEPDETSFAVNGDPIREKSSKGSRSVDESSTGEHSKETAATESKEIVSADSEVVAELKSMLAEKDEQLLVLEKEMRDLKEKLKEA